MGYIYYLTTIYTNGRIFFLCTTPRKELPYSNLFIFYEPSISLTSIVLLHAISHKFKRIYFYLFFLRHLCIIYFLCVQMHSDIKIKKNKKNLRFAFFFIAFSSYPNNFEYMNSLYTNY